MNKTLPLFIFLSSLLGGCASSGNTPGYIISDSKEEESVTIPEQNTQELKIK